MPRDRYAAAVGGPAVVGPAVVSDALKHQALSITYYQPASVRCPQCIGSKNVIA
jgi:hypothetical protein